MKSFSRLAALALAVVLSGCAVVHQMGYPDSTSNKGKKVTASLNHFNIFLLVPPDNLDKLMDDLSEQCGNKQVVGVSFNHTVRWLLIGEMNTIEVAGRCAE
jgi:PBP1b-binding outer membrane lipoprotein LpoB